VTYLLESLLDIATSYDGLVFDQWGVLHNGAEPYPHAVDILTELRRRGHFMAVLSNSGRRARANQELIEQIGFPPGLFGRVMSSGEALWQDIYTGRIAEQIFFKVERRPCDAAHFAEGLKIEFASKMCEVEAILLLGVPDDSIIEEWEHSLNEAAALNLPVYCANPDRFSPRPDGKLALQPGALAYAYKDRGGSVTFYGKPHLPVFSGLERAVDMVGGRLLMIGDSLEHDIAGANIAGWDSVFVLGGLHKTETEENDITGSVKNLVNAHGIKPPTFAIREAK